MNETFKVWSWPDGCAYSVTPATRENAEREALLADDHLTDRREHTVVTAREADLMSNASAWARTKALALVNA